MGDFSTAYENIKIRHQQAKAKSDYKNIDKLDKIITELNASWAVWHQAHLDNDTDMISRTGTRMLEILNLTGTINVSDIPKPFSGVDDVDFTNNINGGSSTNIANPFPAGFIPSQISVKDNAGKVIFGLEVTINQSTGAITVFSFEPYTNAIFEMSAKRT